jgi:hypothetical protein
MCASVDQPTVHAWVRAESQSKRKDHTRHPHFSVSSFRLVCGTTFASSFRRVGHDASTHFLCSLSTLFPCFALGGRTSSKRLLLHSGLGLALDSLTIDVALVHVVVKYGVVCLGAWVVSVGCLCEEAEALCGYL